MTLMYELDTYLTKTHLHTNNQLLITSAAFDGGK